MGRRFIIVTKDHSGLGFAKKLLEEGEQVTVATQCEEKDPEAQKQYKKVGQGWVDVISLADAIRTLKSPNTYWIFTENNFPEEADTLRNKGQKVFGTSVLTDKMEHDRKFAVDLAKQCGLTSPTTHEFTSLDEGIAFLDAHLDTAYVFKPDDGTFNYITFVPARKDDADANRECALYMQHMVKDPGPFILQERIPKGEGIEVCVEAWIYEGEPFLATVGLETKRKNTADIGEMCGCAGDYISLLSLDSALVEQTVGRMFDYYKREKYTGIADVNVIITDDGPQFLEVCNRLGYNAHVTLFLGLALDGFGDILADFMDGKIEGMPERFREGWAASLTVFLDHPREGLPVHLDEWWVEHFYPFDGYQEDETWLLTGYSDEVGIFVDHGPTMEAAYSAVWQKVVEEEAVSFPDMYYRTDLGSVDYENAPIRRWQQLQAQGLV
jgi:phosphoribosylamine-glycine ligase